MNKPYFSVIIPTLNEEKYLPILLKALSKQTYRDFEVILVDGKSDDKTVEVLNKYKRKLPQVKLLISDKRNVGYQRNMGGFKAKGKYLIFFDADVNIYPTFMEEVHLVTLKKKIELATTWIEPDSERIEDKILLIMSNIGQEILKVINKQYAGGYNTICTKKLFRELKGYAINHKVSEDHDFAIRAGKINIKIEILQEPKVIWSLRRFRSEGTLSILRKIAFALGHTIIKGPVTHEIFKYPMGGHVHEKRDKKEKYI